MLSAQLAQQMFILLTGKTVGHPTRFLNLHPKCLMAESIFSLCYAFLSTLFVSYINPRSSGNLVGYIWQPDLRFGLNQYLIRGEKRESLYITVHFYCHVIALLFTHVSGRIQEVSPADSRSNFETHCAVKGSTQFSRWAKYVIQFKSKGIIYFSLSLTGNSE